MSYLLYLFSYPINTEVPYCLFFLVVANLTSIVHRLNVKDSAKEGGFFQIFLCDEEFLTFVTLLFSPLMSANMQLFLDIQFLIWAFVNTMDWFAYLIADDP